MRPNVPLPNPALPRFCHSLQHKEQEYRSHLASFGMTAELAKQTMYTLSGAQTGRRKRRGVERVGVGRLLFAGGWRPAQEVLLLHRLSPAPFGQPITAKSHVGNLQVARSLGCHSPS